MTWVRQTSLQAYNYLRHSGLLSTRRMEVYEYLYDQGPATASQMAHYMHRDRASTSSRCRELVGMGLVQETGDILCPITGMEVTGYDVTPNMPTQLTKIKKPSYQQLEDENERLRDEIDELKRQLLSMHPPKRTPYQKSKLCFDPRDE